MKNYEQRGRQDLFPKEIESFERTICGSEERKISRDRGDCLRDRCFRLMFHRATMDPRPCFHECFVFSFSPFFHEFNERALVRTVRRVVDRDNDFFHWLCTASGFVVNRAYLFVSSAPFRRRVHRVRLLHPERRDRWLQRATVIAEIVWLTKMSLGFHYFQPPWGTTVSRRRVCAIFLSFSLYLHKPSFSIFRPSRLCPSFFLSPFAVTLSASPPFCSLLALLPFDPTRSSFQSTKWVSRLGWATVTKDRPI